MLGNDTYKVEEFRSDENYIGESRIVIPASKMLEVGANRLAKEGWKIVMMDVLSTDLIIAVFERFIQEMEVE